MQCRHRLQRNSLLQSVAFLSLHQGFPGSMPSAIAGKESVIRLIHRSCVAINGAFQPIRSATEYGNHFTQVTGEQKNYGLFNVIVNISSLFNGRNNGCEVIIGKNHIRCAFGNIGTCNSHGNSNIGSCLMKGHR